MAFQVCDKHGDVMEETKVCWKCEDESGWHDVLTSEPPPDFSVIIATLSGEVFEAYYRGPEEDRNASYGESWSTPEGCPVYRQTITHWMPLPKPPTS